MAQEPTGGNFRLFLSGDGSHVDSSAVDRLAGAITCATVPRVISRLLLERRESQLLPEPFHADLYDRSGGLLAV